MNNGLVNVSQIADKAVSQAISGDLEKNHGVYTAEQFVDRVCAKLQMICKGYKGKMGSAYGEVEYKRQLALALAENELTTDEAIEPALNYYRGKDEWMPTPAQFVAACRIRHVAGCPTAKQAYLEYCLNHANPNHNWSHEIVRIAPRVSGQAYDIKTMVEKEAYPIYERAYEICMERIRKGEPIDTHIPKALPKEPRGRECSRKENSGNMAALREGLGI